MTKTCKHTLAASLVALLAAQPGFAQQDTNDGGTSGTTTQQQGQKQQAQEQKSGDREMPEAATPKGQGLSDVAEVDTPPGEIGATQGADASTQSADNTMRSDERVVMLDVEGFTEQIYERGFRQGYIRGISDARDRFAMEMQRARADRLGAMGQQQRMESAAGGQLQPMPVNPGASQQEGDQQQAAQGSNEGDTTQPRSQDGQQMTNEMSGAEERGTIIVLPPGVTPEMFVEKLMRNSAQQGG